MTPDTQDAPEIAGAAASGAPFVASGTAAPVGTAAPEHAHVDYFISRTGADAKWAVWIAWQLEAAGYSVIVQDWDFRPGTNFISNMRDALDSARTTIAVFSPDYFKAGKYTEEEWTAAMVRRADGSIPLLPVRVAITDIPTILKPRLYVDFVGVDEATARQRLLDAVSNDKRSKPVEAPGFPGGGEEPAFPSTDGGVAAPGASQRAGGTILVNAPPIDTERFRDRTAHRATLRAFLEDPTVRLVSITGRPGIGKTALASKVLTTLARTADGGDTTGEPAPGAPAPGAPAPAFETILFLNARTTGLSFERIFSDVKGILDEGAASRLGEYWARQDVTLAQKVETLVDTLRDRRILILLDGLESALGPDGAVADEGLRTFIETCLAGSRGPRLAATSRVVLNLPPEVFPEIRGIPLREGLDTEDAVALLKSFDPQGELDLADAKEADLLRAVELTGGIPRGLELLAGILRNDPATSLPKLLVDDRIIGEQVVETLVAEGYRRLSVDEQRVMEVLAVFDHPVPEEAVASVVRQWSPDADVRAALLRLTSSYFVTADRKTGSYLIQSADRIHAYRQIPTRPDDAPPVASAGDAPYDRTAVESRVADYYQSIRRPADELRSIDDLAPQIAEYRHRLRAGEFDAALELLDTIDQPYLFVWGHYTKLVELRQLVLDAPASPKLCAANAASLGLVSQVLGLYDDALRYYERAVDTATRTGDAAAQAEYVGDLGRLYRNLGYMDKAIASSQKALDAATEASDRRAQGRWKDRLGLTYAFVGRLDDGLRLLEEALGIAREFGDRRSEGAATSNIGLIQQIQGKIDDAERAYRDSLAITREIGDRRGDAIILGRLGFIAEGRGDYVGALRQHREALDISISLGERREQSYQLLGLGRARSGVNEPEEAEQLLRQSRDMDMPETGYLAGLALGLLLLRRGSQEAAAALEDTIARCDDRLARSGELFATRYARATALAAMAVGDPAWAAADSAARSGMLGPAADEMDRALAICPAVGIVSATVRDLDAIPIDDPALLAPLRSKLDAILADAPRAVPATMPIESTEGQP